MSISKSTGCGWNGFATVGCSYGCSAVVAVSMEDVGCSCQLTSDPKTAALDLVGSLLTPGVDTVVVAVPAVAAVLSRATTTCTTRLRMRWATTLV